MRKAYGEIDKKKKRISSLRCLGTVPKFIIQGTRSGQDPGMGQEGPSRYLHTLYCCILFVYKHKQNTNSHSLPTHSKWLLGRVRPSGSAFAEYAAVQCEDSKTLCRRYQVIVSISIITRAENGQYGYIPWLPFP